MNIKVFGGSGGPRCGQVDPKLGQVGPYLASSGDRGAKMADDGEDDLKNTTPDRQDAVLEASWRALGRDLDGLGAFLGSKARR